LAEPGSGQMNFLVSVTELFNQITFCTEKAIAELSFIKSEALKHG